MYFALEAVLLGLFLGRQVDGLLSVAKLFWGIKNGSFKGNNRLEPSPEHLRNELGILNSHIVSHAVLSWDEVLCT